MTNSVAGKKINWPFWILAGVAGFVYWTNTKPKIDDDTKPDNQKPVVVSPSRVMAESYKSDRSSKLQVLKELSELPKDTSDPVRLDTFNTRSQSLRERDWQPYVDIVSESIYNETLPELIKQLENGK